jgi:acyl-CoA thioesterase-1
MKKIVLFGDSIFNGYRDGQDTDLVTNLFARSLPDWQIDNCSLSGATTEQGLGMLSQVDPQAQIVVCEYGTNDSASDWGISAAAYARNLEEMVLKLDPRRVILVGPCYPNPENAEIMLYYTPARLQVYNQIGQDLAKKYRLPFVDLISPMSALNNISSYYQADGQHLSDAGNQVLAQTILPALKNKIKKDQA